MPQLSAIIGNLRGVNTAYELNKVLSKAALWGEENSRPQRDFFFVFSPRTNEVSAVEKSGNGDIKKQRFLRSLSLGRNDGCGNSVRRRRAQVVMLRQQNHKKFSVSSKFILRLHLIYKKLTSVKYKYIVNVKRAHGRAHTGEEVL